MNDADKDVMTQALAIAAMRAITAEQRLEIMGTFCKGCGCDLDEDTPKGICYCQHDE